MRVFAMLGLAASLLLATTTSQAHVSHKLQLATLTIPVTVEVAALASPTTGPTAHASFSAPHVSTSFHSTPSYHSYSATPSRSFTFRSSSPSISTRPATTSAPRTYNYSVTRSAPAAPAVVHHYHDGGGGGMSATDYLVLNSIVNGQYQGSNDSGSNMRFVSAYQNTPVVNVPDDSLSGWQLAGTGLVVGGLAYGLYRYLDSD